ncbi:putative secreted protein (Por secretion system target) [Winogradskyella epiphytica]|uniref:Putative secreted protein (Por secretion system target) n=1 Tax=Winogradskyella epiphytica TaxID=262005 RepID=A0A2V4XHG2_9FLAO|nr:T9SS type A sorting domain-containing protein [Winogradskyella epiphytica]PYE82720.1 putative secreted protein (Por secretion system target) [Winogradskyella epiphytica]GGW53191.1 hypothetical protein GCM10008085_00250 [Winogradskyella epiphytica]
MKKHYILYVLLAFFSLGFSQSPIVTIDRHNIVGPTATGNDPAISSSGFVRGAGVQLAGNPDQNFITNGWQSTSLADAVLGNEYIEWSTTASVSNSINISRIDGKFRATANGPANYQIFYSLDNFATPGIPVSGVETSPNPADVRNFTGLNITSGTGGTITFRLYAWNAPNQFGYFIIAGQNSWAQYGIAKPGLRMRGTIASTVVFSAESNIVASSFDPYDNIDNYTTYPRSTGLTVGSSLKIGEFTIQDGGDDLTDADNASTILTDLDFEITNSSNLKTIAIFDGSTRIAEAAVTSNTVSFSGLSGLEAPDNGSKIFEIRTTFNSAVTDKEQFQLKITKAVANPLLGSVFEAFDAGAAQTPIVGDDNRINVIADRFIFGQQPTDTNQFDIMTPFPTVIAVDVNGNRDYDYNDTIGILANGSNITPNPNNYPITNGLAVLDNITLSNKSSSVKLVVLDPFFVMSTSFSVHGPSLTLAQQDFDGSTPNWPYSTDVTTFDNGWGTDGYYGVIDSNIATPLNHSSFSGNIFGENDINDEGNGTTGFATLTLEPVSISDFTNVRVSFDWNVHGYSNSAGVVQYRLLYDGVAQPWIRIVEGGVPAATTTGTENVTIPDTVNSISLQIRLRNRNDVNGYTGFDNFKLVGAFDGMIYMDDGQTAGWIGGTPDSTTGNENAYVMSGTYIAAMEDPEEEQIKLKNFFIKEGAKTSIPPSQSIIANATVINNGTLELNSTASTFSSLIGNEVIGEVIYNRHVNQFADSGSSSGHNDLVSAPVTSPNQTFAVLRATNSNIPSGTIQGVPSFLFGPFDQNTNEYINYTATNDPDVVEAGIGYRTASTAPTGSPFKFVGNVITGSLSVPITVGSSTKFNLIGNPYPSYINMGAFIDANLGEFSPTSAGIYAYTGDVEDPTLGFKVYNKAFTDANPEALVAPGQGFFVNSKVGGGTINFTPEMRSAGTSGDFIVGRSAESTESANLTLALSSNDRNYKTDIYFNSNASLGLDPGYDSEMFESNAPNFALYSQLVEDNSGKNMVVQTVHYSDLQEVTIPLGVHIAQGEQATISLHEHFVPEGTMITLYDNLNNTYTDLIEGDYTFTASSTLSGTGRFYLQMSQVGLGLNDNIMNDLQIYTNAHPKAIVVKGQLETQTTFKLYDIQGRMVNSQVLSSKSNEHQIDVSHISAGIYVVELNNTSGSRTQKVIIK